MPLSSREANAYSQSLSGLLHQLMRQLSTLLRQELALARTEVRESLGRWISGMSAIVGGVALLYTGLLLLLAAAVIALALLMPLWLAALIAGVTVCAIGLQLFLYGRRLLKDPRLTPSHFPRSLREDTAVLMRKHPM